MLVVSLRMALEMHPCETIMLNLAAELCNECSYEESAQICQKVLREDPGNSWAKRILSSTLLDEGYLQKAQQLIDDILQTNPHDKKARRILGEIFYDQEQYSRAIEEYTKAKIRFQADPYIYYQLACCYFYLGDFRKSKKLARKINERVLRIVPYFRKNKESVMEMLSEINSAKRGK